MSASTFYGSLELNAKNGLQAPYKFLNHEGAARSRIFEVKQFEYTLFEGILLLGIANIKSEGAPFKFCLCGIFHLICNDEMFIRHRDNLRLLQLSDSDLLTISLLIAPFPGRISVCVRLNR